MPRPRDSSTKAYEAIFLALNEESKSWTQLLRETRLHKDTLSRRLKYLIGREMVRREKQGRGVIYSIIKSEPPEMGWEIPWQCLCMTKEDWEKYYAEVDVSTLHMRKFIYESRFRKLLYETVEKILSIPENKELNNKLIEKNMDDVSMGIFLQNYEKPFCLDCLDRTDELVQSIYSNATGEYICPKCGLVINRVPTYDSVYEYFKHYKPNNSN